MDKDKMNLFVNRAVSFFVGGLVVFAAMNFTVLDSAKKKNAELTQTLDISRYESGRLFADAKEQLANKDYEKAKASLATLFENQPGSAETTEGKKLLATIETAQKATEAKWEAASAGIQKKWTSDRASELRAESDKTRVQLDKGMAETTEQEWEKAKDQIKEDWLKQVTL